MTARRRAPVRIEKSTLRAVLAIDLDQMPRPERPGAPPLLPDVSTEGRLGPLQRKAHHLWNHHV